VVGLVLGLGGAGCGGSVSPTAPTGPASSYSVSVSARADIVPPGGIAQVIALVADQNGAPAPDGTAVQFTSTLGRMDPAQATTRLGTATATFIPIGTIGIADVRAQVGAAQSGPLQLSVGSSTIQVGLSAVDLGGLNVLATANVQGGDVVRFEWFFERQMNPEVITTTNQARYVYPLPGFKDLNVRVTLADGHRVLGSAAVIVE
jgi:hypothetical protein